MQSQSKRIQKLITFSPQLYSLVKEKAERLGLSFPEYLRLLAASDVKKEVEQIPMIDEETEKRIGESLEAYRKGQYTTISTKEELEKYLKNLNKKI
ncbi:hypothetical protein HY612_02175 [Candidatus Roizmanbacteria bacterium]|nr:hypothetical protein [Candidatus Roizmanbacteria bacterium]